MSFALFCILAFALFGAYLRSFASVCSPTAFRTTILGIPVIEVVR